jgi:hypothetical protein
MRSISIAEWILALVTSPDRAATTVGDLAEEATARGVVCFWFSLLRTAAALVLRAIADKPARLAGLAFLGLAMDVGFGSLVAFRYGVAAFIALLCGHPLSVSSTMVMWSVVATMAASLGIGRMLARWAADREIAASLGYVVVAVSFDFLFFLLARNGLRASVATLALLLLIVIAVRTPALAGAVWGRHRRLGTH